MAFVYKAERSPNREASDIGPGTYIGQDSLKVNLAHAPFHSTEKRDFRVGPMTTPGPGTYSTPNLMLKPPLYREPVFGQGGYVRPTGPYVTNEERFHEKHEEVLAGPGSYEIAPKWTRPQRPPLQPSSSTKKLLRAPSAPSIPAPNQAFGYDQTDKGLVRQINPEKVYDGTSKDCVGPGHYNARDPGEIWKNKGTAWHKSKTKRSAVSAPATGEKVGPGAYNESEPTLTPMEKFRPSAAFASRSKRTSYIPPLGKEESPDESLDDEGDGTVPGPGYYYKEDQGSSFSRRKRGQTAMENRQTNSASRFEMRRMENAHVGPGTYGDLRMPVLPKRFSYAQVPFNSNDPRFHLNYTTSPGPGSYNEPFALNKQRDWGHERAFGTTEKRFTSSAGLTTPGPGYYPPDAHKRVGIHNSTNRKQLSVFASKVSRVPETIKEVPAPGQYEAASEFDPPRPPPRSIHPNLAVISESKRKEAAFNIKSKRFGRPVMQLPEKVGPGTYDPKIEKDVQRARGFVKIEGKEAARFPKKIGVTTPGPGTYFVEKPTDWNKQTFNMTFIEQPKELS